MKLRRDSLIERIKDYLPDPDDPQMAEVFRLSTEPDLQRMLRKCRKRAALAADLKAALNRRKEAEAKALAAARKPTAKLKRAITKAVNAIMGRGVQ